VTGAIGGKFSNKIVSDRIDSDKIVSDIFD
jgi:hypothetical protein